MKVCPNCGAKFRTREELQKMITAELVELNNLCLAESVNMHAVRLTIERIRELQTEYKDNHL